MGNIVSLDVRDTRSASGSHAIDTDLSTGGQKGAPTDPLGTTGEDHGPGLTISGGTFNNVAGNQINQTYYAQPVDYDETLRKEMLEWLSTINFRTIFQENIARRTSGTGMGFINSQQFERWLLRKYGILWGTGIPGAGKTVLASIVIEYLQNTYGAATAVGPPAGRALICFGYCRYTEPITVREVLAGLVRQALERHPDTISIVSSIFSQHRRENTKPSQEELLGILIAIARIFEISFFVVDGLDEALDDIKYELLSTLSSLDVHLFITSRPLRHLEDLVPEAEHFEVQAGEEDIDRLISRKIDSTPQLKGLLKAGTLKQELISTVQKKAGGMFLHASLQMESLGRCFSPADVRRTLNQFPRSIEGMYEQTLQRITEAPEPRAELGLRLLQWVVFAQRSLSVADLQHALATCPKTGEFDPDAIIPEETLLAFAEGLVVVENRTAFKRSLDVSASTVSKLQVPHVHLIHYTAKDALEVLLIQYNPSPLQLLASVCIARLKSYKFPQCHLSTVEAFDRMFRDNPLLRYAYLNWSYHATQASLTGERVAQQFVLSCTTFPVVLQQHLDLLSPIHLACWYGLCAIAASLAGDDYDCDARTPYLGLTPLMAAIGGHAKVAHPTYPETAFSLLEFPGVNLNAKDESGKTALMWAAWLGQVEVVEELLKNPDLEINCVDDGGKSAFLLAAQGGHLPVVQSLLAHGDRVDVTLVDKRQRTALMLAAQKGHVAVVKALLPLPTTNLNAVDYFTETALMMASEGGRTETVKELLRHPEILVNTVKFDGDTALSLAASGGRSWVVKELLQAPGIEVNSVNMQGKTPLMMAAQWAQPEVVKVLLQVPGINIDQRSKRGHTALELAKDRQAHWPSAEVGYERIIEALLEFINSASSQ